MVRGTVCIHQRKSSNEREKMVPGRGRKGLIVNLSKSKTEGRFGERPGVPDVFAPRGRQHLQDGSQGGTGGKMLRRGWGESNPPFR